MKYLMIMVVLMLAGCGEYQRIHYVYPGFVQKAIDVCEVNGGIERLVIEASNRTGYVTPGAWGFVICKNTARFDLEVNTSNDPQDWEFSK